MAWRCAGRHDRAHPRMRGENTKTMRFTFTADGSSPHARGKRIHILLVRSMVRLIPACAGKTSQPISKVCTAGAHPRMHGENSRGCRKNAPSGGSSPHARGKLCSLPVLSGLLGLIPACAGKTVESELKVAEARAHPRMRGENTLEASVPFQLWGSSPHARGKHPRQPQLRVA